MISKGNTHRNGKKLARYMMDDDRAKLWELRGFAADNLEDAFRSVHVMAEATKCQQPFFHLYVRTPNGEELSRDQWQRIANRIESKLGLSDQPRAIVFHRDKAGHEHMHVAWSRIDTDVMRAVPLPFFKERLVEVSRQLEVELGLTRVTSERDGKTKAPTRDEFEQARRLGVDIKDVREKIRHCWDHSDNGRSFEAALAEHGYLLAQGDRRAYIVIDHEGGLHALGKRILDVSAAQVRARLADLDRDHLPTVEQARDFLRERDGSREKAGQGGVRDPHREDMAWQDALRKAGIEKEKVERQFVDPTRRLNDQHEIERQAFRHLSSVGGLKRELDHPAPQDLTNVEKRLWTAFHESGNAHAFLEALAEQKIALAIVTKEEADRSHRQAEFARAVGNFSPRYREGQIIAVTEPGPIFRRDSELVEPRRVYRLNERTTGTDTRIVEDFLKPVRNQLQGLDATKEILNARGAERAAYWEAVRLENAQEPGRHGRAFSKDVQMPARVEKTAERAAGKLLDLVGDTLESILLPKLTPEQKRDGERATRERAADAVEATNRSKLIAERTEARRRQQEEQELARQRQRDDGRER